MKITQLQFEEYFEIFAEALDENLIKAYEEAQGLAQLELMEEREREEAMNR